MKPVLPNHIAIVMDGNRRWAKMRGLSSEAGHLEGAEALLRIVREANHLGIKVLTVYSFSTENWSRSEKEINVLMEILLSYLEKLVREFSSTGVRLDTIGDLSAFPIGVQKELYNAKESTKANKGLNLVLALNYGARDDIRRAMIKAAKEYKAGKWALDSLSEDDVAKYLDTASWNDPELLIRTSGEHRLSNFLLWQISYSEVYFSDVLWPDFTEDDLKGAITEYNRRDRRYGG